MTKSEQLRRIRAHINNWESLDKEDWLMEILEDKCSEDELHQLMLEQDIPLTDPSKGPHPINPDKNGNF